MSKNKLSKFEIAKSLALLAVAVVIITKVSQLVLNLIWDLTFKLIDKIAK